MPIETMMLFLGTCVLFVAVSLTEAFFPERIKHPITTSFERLVDSELFLDKTMFIEHLLSSKEEHLVLIGPRRLGKSSMLDMLKQFFESDVNEYGTKREKSKVRRLFEKTDVFKKSPTFFAQHFARYPVIYFNFSCINYSNSSEFSKTFVRMVNKEFARHRYLLVSEALSADDKEIFRKFEKFSIFDKSKGTPNPWMYIRAGRDLAILLGKQYGRKPISLVDDYDAFKTAIVGPMFVESNYQLENMLEVLGLFVGALVTENYILRSLFTGVTRLGAVYRDYAPNLQVMSVFDKADFSPFWGVSDAEVRKLAEKCNTFEGIGLVERYYRGYHVLGTTAKMYTIPSVVGFLQNDKIQSYWQAREGLKNMEKLLKYDLFGSHVDKALSSGIKVRFVKKMGNWRLIIFRDTMMNSVTPDKVTEKVDMFLQFLTETGYFTVRGTQEENEKDFLADIIVPNEEIRFDVGEIIVKSYYRWASTLFNHSSTKSPMTTTNTVK